MMSLLNGIAGIEYPGQHDVLMQVLTSQSSLSSAGYPVIEQEAFSLFLENVPHLFDKGALLLGLIEDIRANFDEKDPQTISLQRNLSVISGLIRTAGITSPSDLWILKNILVTYKKVGIHEKLISGDLSIEGMANEYGFDFEILGADFSFLHSRGLVQLTNGRYSFTSEGRDLLLHDWKSVMAFEFVESALSQSKKGHGLGAFVDACDAFLQIQDDWKPSSSWRPAVFEVEVGSRLVPFVLLLERYRRGAGLGWNEIIAEVVKVGSEAKTFLHKSGIIDENFSISNLGRRVLQRGPGPMGIVYAYHPFIEHHESLLCKRTVALHVARGENIVASQSANQKNFTRSLDALDLFCRNTGFKCRTFIEHAVGQGEAIRQHWDRHPEGGCQYIGADLEKVSTDQAEKLCKEGHLPANSRFIAGADIGEPEAVTGFLTKSGIAIDGRVMVVGNGFHEVRDQTNEKMKAIFSGYEQAGILLLFTEESALSTHDLLSTGWNTYHAGFRYVHVLSKQGLRPAFNDAESGTWSWHNCAQSAGYLVSMTYTTRTRTIYPAGPSSGSNPPISVNYFCIPRRLRQELKIVE